MKFNESADDKTRELILERRIERLEKMLVEEFENIDNRKRNNFENRNKSLVDRYRNR